ncbi:MAG: hypothetical protein B7Y70_16420, partial [Rhizobiales bacterium 35-68-8]
MIEAPTTVARLLCDGQDVARRISDYIGESLDPQDTACGSFESDDGQWQIALHFRHPPDEAMVRDLIALAGGSLIYLARRPLFAWHDRGIGRLDARVVFNGLQDGLFALARSVTRLIDTGSLQRQVFFLLAAALVLGVAPWLGRGTPLAGSREGLPLDAVSLLAASTLI